MIASEVLLKTRFVCDTEIVLDEEVLNVFDIDRILPILKECSEVKE